MANTIMVSGESGSGKSTSIKYLDPKSTFLISCTNKQPQIPGYRTKYIKITNENLDTGNWLVSNSYRTITKILSYINKARLDIKTIVIDDTNYLISNNIFEQALDTGFQKFTVQAKNYYDLIAFAQNLRDDLCVVLMSHIENYGTEVEPLWRLWTSGKMLTSQVNLDGLFSYNIYAERYLDDQDNVQYRFRTKTNGNDTCRSTAGCFANKYIEPNLKKIIDRINEFESTGEPEVIEEDQKVEETEPVESVEETPEDSDNLTLEL